MKTKFTIVLLLMLSSLTFGQKLNVEAGLSHSWMAFGKWNFGEYNTRKFNSNLSLNVNADFNLANDLYLQTGLGYKVFGIKYFTDQYYYDDVEVTETYSVHNLTFPVKLKYYLSSQFFVRGGFNLLYAVKKNTHTVYLEKSTGRESEGDNDDMGELNRFNLSANLSFGYDYSLFGRKFYTGLDYDLVLTSFYENSDSELDIYRQSASITFGYYF